MANFSVKSYFEPTPKLFRKIGVSIASLGNTIGVGSAFHGYMSTDPTYAKNAMAVGVAACVLGWFGKELTNFFTDDQSS